MRLFLPMISAIFFVLSASSAVSEVVIRGDGSRIVIHEDGTWKPAPGDEFSQESIAVAHSGFGVFHFAYDRNRWTVEQHPLSDTIEFIFRHQNGSANVKVVTERVPTSLEGLRELNLDLVRKNDGKITGESRLTVNGNDGLVVDTVSHAYGNTWHSRRYLWTGKEGSVQIICTASETNFKDSAVDFDAFIRGFSTTPVPKT